MNTEVLPITEAEAGADSLCQVYTDSSFDPTQSAYYYLRAVEPETPRWHTYDCAAIAEADRPAVCTNGAYPETIVEMAWTSPIWYQGQ
jgi:predicted RNA-binding protein with PUA-like domain